MQVILAQRRTTSGTQCRPSRIGNRPLPPRARPVRPNVRSRITNREEPYYVLLDEVQYAISDEEMRGEEPPRLYGVLNGCCACATWTCT